LQRIWDKNEKKKKIPNTKNSFFIIPLICQYSVCLWKGTAWSLGLGTWTDVEVGVTELDGLSIVA
jgi:hypothetical protein